MYHFRFKIRYEPAIELTVQEELVVHLAGLLCILPLEVRRRLFNDTDWDGDHVIQLCD